MLPSWIKVFNEELYINLSYQITAAPKDLNFSGFISSLETWRSYPREELLTDWFPQVHAYISQILAYEEEPKIDVSAFSIFNLGGILGNIPRNIIRYTSQALVDYDTKLLIQGLNKEISTVTLKQAEILTYTKPKIISHLTSLTPIKMKQVTRLSVLQKIFIEYQYSNIYNSLNVGSLTISEGL